MRALKAANEQLEHRMQQMMAENSRLTALVEAGRLEADALRAEMERLRSELGARDAAEAALMQVGLAVAPPAPTSAGKSTRDADDELNTA